MTDLLEEPDMTPVEPAELLLGYLDWYRSVIDRKLAGLTGEQLHATVLRSGWTPLELLKHLVYMERRWLRWGFTAEPVPEPWGDDDSTGRWHVAPNETLPELLAALHSGGVRTRAIVTAARLDDLATVGGRFTADDPRPTLAWTLLHVLQEYARHAGHLDIVREILDGSTGE